MGTGKKNFNFQVMNWNHWHSIKNHTRANSAIKLGSSEHHGDQSHCPERRDKLWQCGRSSVLPGSCSHRGAAAVGREQPCRHCWAITCLGWWHTGLGLAWCGDGQNLPAQPKEAWGKKSWIWWKDIMVKVCHNCCREPWAPLLGVGRGKRGFGDGFLGCLGSQVHPHCWGTTAMYTPNPSLQLVFIFSRKFL